MKSALIFSKSQNNWLTQTQMLNNLITGSLPKLSTFDGWIHV